MALSSFQKAGEEKEDDDFGELETELPYLWSILFDQGFQRVENLHAIILKKKVDGLLLSTSFRRNE